MTFELSVNLGGKANIFHLLLMGIPYVWKLEIMEVLFDKGTFFPRNLPPFFAFMFSHWWSSKHRDILFITVYTRMHHFSNYCSIIDLATYMNILWIYILYLLAALHILLSLSSLDPIKEIGEWESIRICANLKIIFF